MIFSYKTRQFLRRALSGLLPALLLIVAALICWIFWLQRFLVYTPQGAVFQFGLSAPVMPGVEPQKPQKNPVSIEYLDRESTEDTTPGGMQALNGYYIDPYDLTQDLSEIRPQLEQLPAGTPVLLDVKNGSGRFFFTTDLGPIASSSHNIGEMDELLSYLLGSDLYVIARVSALQDTEFASENTDCGILTNRGALWKDGDSRHWLDPTQDGTLTYLTRTALELRSMGFDEVVFRNFAIPQADTIAFDGDRAEALKKAAQTLVSGCATEQFTVSFSTTDPSLQIPDSRSRLYLEDVAAADVLDVRDQVRVTNTAVKLVFFAETKDTRYDVCGVLRLLELANA